ncbi:MAG: hypothetical protein U0V75_02795 [Ferruginibacter sp.]
MKTEDCLTTGTILWKLKQDWKPTFPKPEIKVKPKVPNETERAGVENEMCPQTGF